MVHSLCYTCPRTARAFLETESKRLEEDAILLSNDTVHFHKCLKCELVEVSGSN